MSEDVLNQPAFLEPFLMLRLKETLPTLRKPHKIDMLAYRMPLQLRATKTTFVAITSPL